MNNCAILTRSVAKEPINFSPDPTFREANYAEAFVKRRDQGKQVLSQTSRDILGRKHRFQHGLVTSGSVPLDQQVGQWVCP
jgi:hypothetical protein